MFNLAMWRKLFRSFVRPAMIVFFLLLVVGGCTTLERSFLTSQLIFPQVFSLNERIPRMLLFTAVPILSWVNADKETPFWGLELEPLSVLQSEIPLLAQVKTSVETAPAITDSTLLQEEPKVSDSLKNSSLSSDCMVIIYHAHTGETYTLTDGMDYLQGKKGGVVTVGAAIKEVLENDYHIKAVHSEKQHDIHYTVSYKESEKTLRELLSANPKAQVVLDVHRDAGRSRKNSLAQVKGQEVAPILFIIGSDSRQPFPTWKENYQFASELADRINNLYPGLCLGVRVGEGRYNQILHPRSVLVEVGSASNSTEEAVTSARLFAGILGETIRDMIKKEDKG